MDLSSITNLGMDTTFSNASYTKKVKELDEYKNALEEAGKSNDDESLKEMCVEFEKYFLKEMYKAMKKTVNYESFMNYGGQSEEIFSDMLEEEYIKKASDSGGIGLAKKLYEQLKSPTSMTGSVGDNVKVNVNDDGVK